MASRGDWQKQLTFSDRLSVISKMQVSVFVNDTLRKPYTNIQQCKAYQEANPDSGSSDATKHAKLEETTCRNNSSTLVRFDLIE